MIQSKLEVSGVKRTMVRCDQILTPKEVRLPSDWLDTLLIHNLLLDVLALRLGLPEITAWGGKSFLACMVSNSVQNWQTNWARARGWEHYPV